MSAKDEGVPPMMQMKDAANDFLNETAVWLSGQSTGSTVQGVLEFNSCREHCVGTLVKDTQQTICSSSCARTEHHNLRG